MIWKKELEHIYSYCHISDNFMTFSHLFAIAISQEEMHGI